LHEEFERLEREGGCTIAFLASGMEGIKVRLTAKAETETAVDEILSAEEVRVRAIIGNVVFGNGRRQHGVGGARSAGRAGPHFGARRVTHRRHDRGAAVRHPGASKAFRGSIVSYASDVKFDLLGVPEGPVISEAAVTAMVHGACRVLGTDVGIAVTGVAGPDRRTAKSRARCGWRPSSTAKS
jgi:nicotinamide-nucleotide amidase